MHVLVKGGSISETQRTTLVLEILQIHIHKEKRYRGKILEIDFRVDAGNDQVQAAVVLMRLLGLRKNDRKKKKMYLKEKILCRDTLAHIDVLENILHSLGSGVVQSLLQDENNSTWTYEWNVHFIQQLHALLRGVDLAGILISDGLDNRLSSSSGSLGLRMKRNTKNIPSEHAPNLSETEP